MLEYLFFAMCIEKKNTHGETVREAETEEERFELRKHSKKNRGREREMGEREREMGREIKGLGGQESITNSIPNIILVPDFWVPLRLAVCLVLVFLGTHTTVSFQQLLM